MGTYRHLNIHDVRFQKAKNQFQNHPYSIFAGIVRASSRRAMCVKGGIKGPRTSPYLPPRVWRLATFSYYDLPSVPWNID